MTEPTSSIPLVEASDWPAVSVIMPVYREEKHLSRAIQGVLDQEYPGRLELVLAVAPSPDKTQAIAEAIANSDARVRLVANPTGRTPSGLNRAIAASSHDLIVRVDAHAELPPRYIRQAVRILLLTGADNVGGLMDARGESDFEKAVAAVMRSPFGMGSAPFHIGGSAGPADSVYLGVFLRRSLQSLGGFDEHFARAQDWELNYRIRKRGGLVWFAPELKVVYRPRSSFREVARQFRGSGGWRRQIIRRYPQTASMRYLAAPLAVTAVVSGACCGLAGLAGPRWLRIGWLAPAGYAVFVVLGGSIASRGTPLRCRLLAPPVLATMHMSWGVGFLLGGE